MTRRKMRRFAEGGDTYQTARRARKEADIESDYQKALKAGKNAQIALAKKEQRMADAADDFAKWTRADRTQTRAAERAAESALSEARRTQGRSITDRDLGSRINPAPTEPIKTPKIEAPDLSGYFKAPTSSKAAAPRPRPRPATTAPTSAPRTQRAGVTYSGDALTREQARLAAADKAYRAARGIPDTGFGGSSPAPALAPSSASATASSTPTVSDRAQNLRAQVLRALQARQAGTPAFTMSFPSTARADDLRRAAEARRRSRIAVNPDDTGEEDSGYRKGGSIKKKPAKKMAKGGAAKKPVKKSCGGGMRYAKGGSIDGCAVRGKTRAKRTK